MNFVIPLAGRSRRFVEAGYSGHKGLLTAHGRTLLEWSVDSLPLNLASKIIFIGLKEDEDRFGIEKIVLTKYSSFADVIYFRWLENETSGQAATVLAGLSLCDKSVPLIIFNIDTSFHDSELETALLAEDWSGFLGSFSSINPAFSFAEVDEQGEIIRVVEKEAVSDIALNGLYCFRSIADFERAFTVLNLSIASEKGESFVAPLFQYLINKSKTVVHKNAQETWILGTPKDYEFFLENGKSYADRFPIKQTTRD